MSELDLKISELPEAGAVATGDEVVGLQDGTTKRFDAETFKGNTGISGSIVNTPVSDINDPTEFNSLDDTLGDTRKAQQIGAKNDIFAIYCWDSSTTLSENPPFSVDGDGGMWILQVGSWQTQTLNMVSGFFVEEIRVAITSSGGVVTLALDKLGGGNLTMVEGGKHILLITTPAKTLALTAGSDVAPTLNFVYVENGVLTKNLLNWPTSKHQKVGRFLIQSAASVLLDEPLKSHLHMNALIEASDDIGTIEHAADWIRAQHATYKSGVDFSTVVGASQFEISTTAGVIRQYHLHNFPAFDTGAGSNIYIVNDATTPLKKETDLVNVLTDSLNVSMSNRRFVLIVWGIINQSGSKIFINLPSASYNNNDDAIADVNDTANFTIGADFVGVGFLINKVVVRHTVAGNVWSILDTVDLRGQQPSLFVGGIAGITTKFAANTFDLFDPTDPTKRIGFSAVNITAGQRRVMEVPDQNGIIAHRDNDNNFTVNQTFDLNVKVKGQGYSPINVLTDAANIATNCNLGNAHRVTLTANRTLGAPTNMQDGATYIWRVKQDATGNRTLAYNSVFKFEGGTIPILSIAANAVDILIGFVDEGIVHLQIAKGWA